MTGYPSKKAAALDEDGMYLVHHTAQPAQDGECKHCTDGCPACDARKLPEQEPVAWIDMRMWPPIRFPEGTLRCHLEHLDGLPLYTTPPAQPAQERNFCSRCGKRTNDIHTCTPPQEKT